MVDESWTSDQLSWGIVRYASGSGSVPEADATAFDGWYMDRSAALAIFEDWTRRFPQWVVALVRSDVIRFGDGDFSGIERPLTKREEMISAKSP